MGVCSCEQMRSKRKENPEQESKNDIKKEAIIHNNPIIPIPETVITATKSLCKILAGNKVSSGFLIKLFIGEEDFFCLMTNEHIITKDLIENKEKIKFYYDNESKMREIYLNNKERFIKEFTYLDLDITVIEIIYEDKIEEQYFLFHV